MKSKLTLPAIILAAAAVIVAAGCMSNPSGSAFQNGAVPNKFDTTLFDIHTNIVTVTNTVTKEVPVYATNQVPVFQTNQLNQTVTTYSNIVVTNFVRVPVQVEQEQTNYDRTVKASTTAAIQAGGAAVNTFAPGMGTLGSLAAGAVIGFLGWLRSSKQGTKTQTALQQEIETAREFMQALPNGQAYDQAFVQFLKDHQQEADIVNSVVTTLDRYVSNPDAKAGAQEMVNFVNALKATASPLPPVSAQAPA